MSFGLTYSQLTPVAGNVRAGLVAYDGNATEHQAVLREALPRFLGSLGAVHGEVFPQHHLEAVIDVVHAKEIEVDFLLVALDVFAPVMIAGLATGAPTFGMECDRDNNLKIFPVKHGEDLCVDKAIAKLFREKTRSAAYPDGIGSGTWFMGEQIRRSVGNPDWVFAGRDNEHSLDNPPIIGLMNKFGAVHGTEHNSAILQLNELTSDMKRRWGVPVKTQGLPADALGITMCPNNFTTRWASPDGKQQVGVIFTRMASTFDGQPVVWTKIKSNGNLPDSGMLKEVLASLMSAGCEEIASPQRRWGVPRSRLMVPDDISRVFGGTVPVMHIHANNEPQIVKALVEMQAAHRKFGHGNMVSGAMNLNNMPDPVAILGRQVPEATVVTGIDMGQAANEPYFDVVPESPFRQSQAIKKPRGTLFPVAA